MSSGNAAAADGPTTVGVVSSLPDHFADVDSGAIDCPSATDCWIAGVYPPAGGDPDEFDSAVIRVVNGVAEAPQMIPESPNFGADAISCWSSDDCLISTGAFEDASHSSMGAGVSVLHDGLAGAPMPIATGLNGASSRWLECAGSHCVLAGFGTTGEWPRETRVFFAVNVDDGVAGPVTVFPPTIVIYGLSCVATACVVAGLDRDQGFIARFDGLNLVERTDTGEVVPDGLACRAPDDCMVIGQVGADIEQSVVARVQAGVPVTPRALQALPDTHTFVRSISCDATLDACLLAGLSIGGESHALAVPVVDGTPGDLELVPGVSRLKTTSCFASACTGVAQFADGHSRPSPRLVTGLSLPATDTAAPIISITSPAPGARLAVGESVTAQYTCDDGTGSGTASCVGTLTPGGSIASGDLIPTNSPGPFTLSVTASDHAGNTATSTVSAEVVAGSAAGTVPGGGTITTGSTATPDQPVQTTLTTPDGPPRDITVVPQPTGTPAPAGYSFFDEEVVLHGPDATPSDPYEVTFTVDASALAGRAPADVDVFRNGVLVPGCTSPTDAIPSPCVVSRGFVPGPSGDAQIVVRTAQFSVWSLGLVTQRSASALRVDPVVARFGGLGVSLTVGTVSARLTTVAGRAIPGQVVAFTTAGKSVCSATTNNSGIASCSVSVPTIVALLLAGGVTARYSGTQYLPSSGRAGLVG